MEDSFLNMMGLSGMGDETQAMGSPMVSPYPADSGGGDSGAGGGQPLAQGQLGGQQAGVKPPQGGVGQTQYTGPTWMPQGQPGKAGCAC